VIGGEVQDHGHVDAAGLLGVVGEGLELEARALEDEAVGGGGRVVAGGEHGGRERHAEVAADEGTSACGGQQGAGERGDGALAVGAGDQRGREAAPQVVGDGEGERHLAVHGGGGGEALAGGEERPPGGTPGLRTMRSMPRDGGVGDVVLAEEGDDAGRELAWGRRS
jgi:hypothetical protein